MTPEDRGGLLAGLRHPRLVAILTKFIENPELQRVRESRELLDSDTSVDDLLQSVPEGRQQKTATPDENLDRIEDKLHWAIHFAQQNDVENAMLAMWDLRGLIADDREVLKSAKRSAKTASDWSTHARKQYHQMRYDGVKPGEIKRTLMRDYDKGETSVKNHMRKWRHEG